MTLTAELNRKPAAPMTLTAEINHEPAMPVTGR
ncbi:hypothetical protein C8E87_8140 [Paractinoplanes brasiliensis]|uniref:Uncharacterized protein n=1 Tax=Paractinoplanes brasiliensis TaxID=52695 RepID=A0A4R6JAG3_9ACTN|nr:hypothetical protein C8E87_8140 [Actinoplanes brasiliensis]